jgi:hypothetical protein
VAQGVVDEISQEGLRALLCDEEVSFQAVKTWKASTAPAFEVQKNRVVELYDIAEGMATPGPGNPTVEFSMDELMDKFGPLNVQPRPGRQWAPVVRRNMKSSTDAPRRRRQRATYTTRTPRESGACSGRWTCKKDTRGGEREQANNLALASVPTNASFLNRIECHFTALRYFALNGTDHRCHCHEEQNSMIRRYIAWRNRHTDDEALRAVSQRAKVA